MKFENYDISLPETGATLADYRDEGKNWGAVQARNEVLLVQHAEKTGVLTEQAYSDIISPGLLKDWDLAGEQLRAIGSSNEQVEAFYAAARKSRLEVIASEDSK